MNIAGLVVAVLICAGVVMLFVPTVIPALEYWKIAIPLITLVMGFIFGKGSKEG